MSQAKKLCTLAERIALKARRLIPRSSNRVAYGATDGQGHAVNSQWKSAPQYIQFQMLASRTTSHADSSVKELRQLIDFLNLNVQMLDPDLEAMMDQNFRQALQKKLAEWKNPEFPDLQSVINRLQAPAFKRSHKKHHKPEGFMWMTQAEYTAMEREEGSAKNAVRYRIGNCGENASLALVMFAEYPGPNGDRTLPDLANDPLLRPRVEKVAATSGHDHAFLLIGRPAGEINDWRSWALHDVIVCDPWWTHEGCAFRADQPVAGWADYVCGAGDLGRLKRRSEIRLGQGHSERFRGKEKNGALNYYGHSVQETSDFLRKK